jgi:acyl carrier protein
MKSEIRDFLALNAGLPKDKLSDDFDLFANEVWDSLLIVRFVTFAEAAFKVRVNLVTLSEEKIRTIANAAEFLHEIKK